jgi:hypothetical protein
VESRQSLCRLQMDSGLMIQKYIYFVVFKVDSTWTKWSPSGLHRSPGGVKPECVGECKVHVALQIFVLIEPLSIKI